MNESATPRLDVWGWGFFLLFSALLVYFGYYAVYGNRGLLVMLELQQQVDVRQAELTRMQGERMALERKIRLLSDDSVDPDLLEEQARSRLGLSAPDEVVILKKHP